MLQQCAESIQKAWPESGKGQVVVVDNGSTDQSLLRLDLCSKLPFEIKIICNNNNRGFAAACNQGATLGKSEYLLFLNPDTRLFGSSLSGPLDFISNPANDNVGIVGIQLVDEQSDIARSCSRFPSLRNFIAQAIGINLLPGFQHWSQSMSEWPHDSTRQVDQVIGAFFLIRRSLFLALGGFDERFFVYFEEMDLSLRARQTGWASVYLSEVQAFHCGGGISSQVKAHRLFYSLRSRLLFGFKHFKRWHAWILVAATLILEPITRSIFSLSRGEYSALQNTLRAFAMVYADLPSILSLRGVKR